MSSALAPCFLQQCSSGSTPDPWDCTGQSWAELPWHSLCSSSCMVGSHITADHSFVMSWTPQWSKPCRRVVGQRSHCSWHPLHTGDCHQGLCWEQSCAGTDPQCTSPPAAARAMAPAGCGCRVGMSTHGPSTLLWGHAPAARAAVRAGTLLTAQKAALPGDGDRALCQDTPTPGALPAAVPHVPSCGPRRAA